MPRAYFKDTLISSNFISYKTVINLKICNKSNKN